MDNEVKYPGRRRPSTRAIVTVAMFLFWIFLGWYAGADYTVRDGQAAANLLIASWCAGVVYFIPVWTKDGSFKW